MPVNRRQFLFGALGAAAAAAAGGTYALKELLGGGTARARPNARARSSGSPAKSPKGGPDDPLHAKWVVAENAKPGTPDWQIANAGEPGAIEGYANVVSAQHGDKVALHVSTRASQFHVEAYRMGWYGGQGGRLVWRSGDIPRKQQAGPAVTPG